MKLHTEYRQRTMFHRGDRTRRWCRQRPKFVRDARHLIPVAHPHIELLWHTGQKIIRSCYLTTGPTKLSCRRVLDLAAQRFTRQLHPVADAEHRNAQLKDRWIALRRTFLV